MHLSKALAFCNQGTVCELLSIRPGERTLTYTDQKPTKVLAVDSVLKGLAAILLTITTSVSAWLLVTVIQYGDRITKNETKIESYDKNNMTILRHLQDISSKQSQILQNQARFDTEIKFLKKEPK